MQTELALVYTQGGKGRRIHYLLYAPSLEIVKQITDFLLSKGRIDYDGRPIFGFTSIELVEMMKSISNDIEIIPAHAWTPWFSVFGANSGFDSLKECFKDQLKHIYAIESGMSADPEMLWRMEAGANIVSFSDAHSFWPWRLGREATIFELEELSYGAIIKAIRTGEGLKATIETPPEYGKYHWDGHRDCKFSCSPEKTKELEGKCPKCGKPLTIGVEYRVEELAKHPRGHMPVGAKPFYKLIPLHELIAFALGSSLNSKKTWALYNELIEGFGSELEILLRVDKNVLVSKMSKHDKPVELIINNRISNLKVKPGFDGEYGEIMVGEEQNTLFD